MRGLVPGGAAGRRWRGWALVAGATLLASPLFAVGVPEAVRLVPLEPRTAPVPAVFSHWRHDAQLCMGCHPAVFPQSNTGTTHARMREGGACGACHDGQTSRAISAMRCEECHVPW